jgi:type IV pilus assembly protein PilC
MNWEKVKDILLIDIFPGIPSFPSISMQSSGRGWRYHFLHQLSSCVYAGMSLQEAVRASLQRGPFNMRRTLRKVGPALAEGQTLSEALLFSAPKLFPRSFYAMIEIGEMTGTLADVLKLLEDRYEQTVSSRIKLSRVFMYPTMVLSIGTLIILFLLVKVVPTFAEIFHDLGSALPYPTQVLVDLSDSFMDYYLFFFLTFFLFMFILLIRLVLAIFKVDVNFLSWVGRSTPFLGRLMHHDNMLRFSSLMSTLLATGMSPHEALSLCESEAMHPLIIRAVKGARMEVAGGRSLSEAISAQPVFSPTLAWLISVGEQKGELAESFNAFVEIERARIRDMLEMFRRFFEPAVLLLMSCVVSYVVVAMWLPVLKISELV